MGVVSCRNSWVSKSSRGRNYYDFTVTLLKIMFGRGIIPKRALFQVGEWCKIVRKSQKYIPSDKLAQLRKITIL